MPKIFSKDCKVKVIEYGGEFDTAKFWESLQKQLMAPFQNNVRKIFNF